MKLNYDTVFLIASNIGILLAGVYIGVKVFKQTVDKYLKNIGSSVSRKINNQSNVDLAIIKRMEQVKEIVEADRILVCEFHNGEHYANGRSALKFSCTYEVTRANVKSIQRETTSIPISCMPKYIHTILDNEIIKINKITEIKEEMPATYDLKVSHDVNAYTDIAIKNSAGEPVGFIDVQWTDKHKLIENDAELYKLAAFIEEKILNDNLK